MLLLLPCATPGASYAAFHTLNLLHNSFLPPSAPGPSQMLLSMWQRGTKNAGGKVTMAPWSKDFIDTVFELNDPLCTKLKSAYDNKLTDTQVWAPRRGV